VSTLTKKSEFSDSQPLKSTIRTLKTSVPRTTLNSANSFKEAPGAFKIHQLVKQGTHYGGDFAKWWHVSIVKRAVFGGHLLLADLENELFNFVRCFQVAEAVLGDADSEAFKESDSVLLNQLKLQS
jgi:hypothetical protein